MFYSITTSPSPNLGLVVVIPARNETNLLDSLSALHHCQLPSEDVEVIVVINDSREDTKMVKVNNAKVSREVEYWSNENSTNRLQFHVIYAAGLPPKHAGVGLARRIGMDEACRRLESIGRPDGIITGFDADSRCDPNYLSAVASRFREDPELQAASIYFEHPLSGDQFVAEVYEAIALYELHLRYFIQAQRYAGFPFAYHTVGSSMAVRCSAYRRQGGMNRRKAGEDFYFLHKFTPLGHYAGINDTRVIPSPRPSDRVPFGTGKAIQQILESTPPALSTYSPQSFADLKRCFDLIVVNGQEVAQKWVEMEPEFPESIRHFFQRVDGRQRIEEIAAHTASPEAFRNRFFRWFNAFLIMKYVHFARDHYYPDVEVEEAAAWLLEALGEGMEEPVSVLLLLERFRKLERAQ